MGNQPGTQNGGSSKISSSSATASKDPTIHAGEQKQLEATGEDQELNVGFGLNNSQQQLDNSTRNMTVNDFTFLDVVGKGSFGKVTCFGFAFASSNCCYVAYCFR